MSAQDELMEFERRLVAPGSPYAMTGCGASSSYVYGPKTLFELCRKAAARGPKSFLIANETNYSYSEIFTRALLCADALGNRFKVRAGDRIGLVVEEGPDWVVGFFGILAAGAAVVLLPRSSEYDLRECLEDLGCKYLISSPTLGSILDTDRTALPTLHLDQLELNGGRAEFTPTIAPADEALIAFTSGSTGKPKAVSLSHRSVVTGLMNMLLVSAISNAGRKREPAATAACPLILAPMAYIAGYSQILLAALLGGKFAHLANWTVSSLGSFVRKNEITSIVGLSPETALELVLADTPAGNLHSIRTWHVHGAQTRQKLIAVLAERIPNVVISTSYGLTETNGAICASSWRATEEMPASLGRLAPNAEIRILDDEGNMAAPGGSGQIWVRGPMLMSGYLSKGGGLWGLEGGWLNTGDIGWMTDDRELHVDSRRGDLIEIDGVTISTPQLEEDIEAALASGSAFVVCLDANCGHRFPFAVAIVGCGRAPDAEIIFELLSNRWSLKERPLLLFLDKAPQTASGKIDRNVLKAVAIARASDGAMEHLNENAEAGQNNRQQMEPAWNR